MKRFRGSIIKGFVIAVLMVPVVGCGSFSSVSSVVSGTKAEVSAPSQEDSSEPEKYHFVKVADYIPDILVELKYASSDNFVGEVIYGFTDAYLRYGTVKKLAAAQKELAEQGYGLKIWDAFRPASAQFTLWEKVPDPDYVADPNTGYSDHTRGNAVDVTLVTADGKEVEMPTGFDDFTGAADRDYSDVGEAAAANALLLEQVMEENGFEPLNEEWWHFSDSTSYPADEEFDPQ